MCQLLPDNAIISIAKKVEDNVLHVMTTLVIMLPSAVPKAPATNPPSTLLRAPNALVHKVGMYTYGQAQGGQAMA